MALTALITGGGKGVGAGIAAAFAKSGIRVCMNYNSSYDFAKANLDKILADGGEAFLYKADVTDGEQIDAMIDETVKRYGGIDILVNNAALQPNLYINEYTPEQFAKIWEINIGGYYRTTQRCLPYLKKSEQPRIINVSSIHGKRPAVFDVGYSMTKAAIKMFTREAALEFAQYGINVNTIDLGACYLPDGKTGNYPFRIHHDRGIHENHSNHIPFTTPDDVGGLALFLASAQSKTISGAGIRIDSGSMMF